MSQGNKHLILRYLDEPYRLAFLSITNVLVIFVPFAVCVGLFDRIFSALFVSGLSYYGYRRLKKVSVGGKLVGIFYWYLPHNKRALPKSPKSHIREFVG